MPCIVTAEVVSILERDVLDRALDGLTAVFQPIVGLSDFRIVGYEALARVPGPPDLPPDRWLERFADAGRRDELELACLSRIAEFGPPPNGALLFVNAGPALLSHPMAHELRDALPDRLVIELTEREPVADYDALTREIAGWRSRGVSIAVDDTGSGWSTLRHVLQISPDFVKLDRSLIDGVDHDRNRRALVCALGAFAKETGAVVIAEGVERVEELDVLREAEVSLAQGWLFARPGRPWPIATVTRDGRGHGERPQRAHRPDEGPLYQRLGAASRTREACAIVVDHLHGRGGLMPSIYLLRDGLLRCEAQRGLWQVLDGLPAGSGVTGRAFANCETLRLEDVRVSGDYLEAIPGARSVSRSSCTTKSSAR
jgi:EAL domain-containing protein (putative c-di-GMP-specific phosphodiesterase class I)